jgi:hypothetical protein
MRGALTKTSSDGAIHLTTAEAPQAHLKIMISSACGKIVLISSTGAMKKVRGGNREDLISYLRILHEIGIEEKNGSGNEIAEELCRSCHLRFSG